MVFFILILFLCQLAGEFFVAYTELNVPGPVCGMLLLLIGLFINGKIPDELAKVGDAFLNNLTLLFIPAGVGIMIHAPKIANDWLPISVGLVASTILTIGVTGGVMSFLNKTSNVKEENDGGQK